MKEMMKNVEDLLYLEQLLSSAIHEAVNTIHRDYKNGRETDYSEIRDHIEYIISEQKIFQKSIDK